MIVSEGQVTTREVAAWRGLHLLHFQGSSCSQKVRVLLREKGLVWESHPVNLAADAHVSPWFLGINPRGVVPVLVHDGVVHIESNDILEYLDRLPSPASPFFPQTAEELALVRRDLEHEDSLHTDLRNITMGFLVPRRLARKSGKTLERWEREGRADPKRALEVKWWREYAERGVPPEAARASVEVHRRVFEDLDRRLAASGWLMGDRLSVLDIAWFITVRRLRTAGYPMGRHPRLDAWYRRLSKRPAFDEETRDPLPLRLVHAVYSAAQRLRGTRLVDLT